MAINDNDGVSFAKLLFYGALSIIAFIVILAILCGLIAATVFVPIWWIKVLCAAVVLTSSAVVYYKLIKY